MVQIEHIIEDCNNGTELERHILCICDSIETAMLKILKVCDHPNISRATLINIDDEHITFIAHSYDDDNEIINYQYFIISEINVVTKDDLRS